jgi:hypothetical protein
MRARLLAVLLGTVGVIALTGCAASVPEPAPTSAIDSEAVDQHTTDEESADAPATTTIPAGARAASADFPFPVPEDWAEHEPFAEEKIGGSAGVYGSLVFPGDAASAAASYQALLRDAGYAVHPHPLGEVTHDAAFIVEGPIDGVAYSGQISFDTIADGTPRVAINLTQK